MSIDSKLQSIWYERVRGPAFPLLIFCSWLFGAVSALRRVAYRTRILKSIELSRPVVVIGNVTVGGTGKTPLVAWLAAKLIARGLRVGVIARGYGGRARNWPHVVTAKSDAREAGDEAVLLAQVTGAIVVAGPDRVASARRAIELGADIVLSDDGLQHYRLRRQREIAVVDATRGVGNGLLLPAGPLREPVERMKNVDVTVIAKKPGGQFVPNNLTFASSAVTISLGVRNATNLADATDRSLSAFAGIRVHAVAGVGNPESFFAGLEQAGLIVERHVFPDHFAFRRDHLTFADDAPVLMTQKDAVKCRAFAESKYWSVPLELEISQADEARLWSSLSPLIHASTPAKM